MAWELSADAVYVYFVLPVSCLETGYAVTGQERCVSPELQAAQERLTQLRQQLGNISGVARLEENGVSHGRFSPPPPSSHQAPQSDLLRLQTQLAEWPAHLGWETDALTAVLRPLSRPQTTVNDLAVTPVDTKLAVPALSEPAIPEGTAVFPLYPDLALAMLRNGQTAVGRVWLLLRTMDEAGSGWLTEAHCRKALTARESSWRVCGLRQWRNLLRDGEGIFWQQKNGRLWLASVARVALALGVQRLNQRPVMVPVAILMNKIGVVRAHFYASFHSSRMEQESAERQPIARATLADLSHVTAKTQRTYEKQARVQAERNFAVGELYSPERAKEVAWQKGQASFRLVDVAGKQGRPGAAYVAWQLPNSYSGPHALLGRGRQKRINRQLADLLMKGMAGNGRTTVDTCDCRERRFFRNGRLAAQAFSRARQSDEVYWTAVTPGQTRLWHVVRVR